MDYRTYEERLKYLLEMAEKGRLFSLQEVAEKYECSYSTVQRMVSHLRSNGHDITYSRARRKFFIKK